MASKITTASVAKAIGGRFRGFMMTVDMIPPLYLKFAWNPTEYLDDWTADFSSSTNPQGSWPIAQFSGLSDRVCNFQLRFDIWNPDQCWSAKDKVATQSQAVGGTKAEPKRPSGLQIPLAVLELMKLPKPPAVQWALSKLQAWTKCKSGATVSAPPLVMLCLALDKVLVGFVRKAAVKPLKFNKLMQMTRCEVDVEFLVQETLVTTVEQGVRLAYGAASIADAFKKGKSMLAP